MNHLNNTTRNFIKHASTNQRIDAILNLNWIEYPRAQKIMKNMNDCISYIHSSNTRTPFFLVLGDHINGKSTLLSHFLLSNLNYINKNFELINPIIKGEIPLNLTKTNFYNKLVPFPYSFPTNNETIESKFKRILSDLHFQNSKVLLIDNFQNLLTGSMLTQKIFLNTIKYIANDLKLSIICFGTNEYYESI